MSLKVQRKTYVHRIATTETDKVIGWAVIPTGGVFRSARVKFEMVAQQHSLMDEMHLYGLSAYFIPINDPDTMAASPDTTWDNFVPKDKVVAVGAVEMDEGAASTPPAIAPGSLALEQMINAGGKAIKLFRMERFQTFASRPRGFQDTSASEADLYRVTDTVNFNVNKAIRARSPSVVLFAVSNPTTAIGTGFTGTANLWAPAAGVTAEHEWMRTRYLRDTVVDAVPWLTGGVTTDGTTTRFQEAAELAGRMLEQTFESTAGAFNSDAFDCWTIITYQLEVPGSMQLKSLRAN